MIFDIIEPVGSHGRRSSISLWALITRRPVVVIKQNGRRSVTIAVTSCRNYEYANTDHLYHKLKENLARPFFLNKSNTSDSSLPFNNITIECEGPGLNAFRKFEESLIFYLSYIYIMMSSRDLHKSMIS